MIDAKIRKELKNYKNLRRYALHFDRTEGSAEQGGYLPYLVIWFRELFKKANIDDGQVPQLFGYDEDSDEAQDFWTWGHNSRYNHTFCVWLEQDIDYALNLAFDLMEEYNLTDFDPNIEEIIKKERN